MAHEGGSARGAWTRYRPTDLTALLSCEHLVALERSVHEGTLERVYRDDPALELLRLRGLAHEERYLKKLAAEGKNVVSIAANAEQRDGEFWARGIAKTLEAMRAGAEVIYQAPLSAGGYSGIADFLLRVETPSQLGAWSYEVLDAKLAVDTKAITILQLCLYSELIERVQGVWPRRMAVLTGSGAIEHYCSDHYRAYYTDVRRWFEACARDERAGTYPEPVDHCDVCSWWANCDKRRRADDHLSLVPRISRRQRGVLARNGVATMTALSSLPADGPRLEGMARLSLERLREQARIQVQGKGLEKPIHELLEPQPKLGLNALPEPTPGDVFLDFEGDHLAVGGGLEYLIGWVTLDSKGEPVYERHWAYDAASEKKAFERLVTFLGDRGVFDYPGFRVYHYGAYEESALKRLMYRHGVRDRDVDDFLRRNLFVDLGRIVQQALRASVESYSLKDIEKLADFEREVPPREASKARKNWLISLELGEPASERAASEKLIEAYNREDCLAVRRLRNWLEEQRKQLTAAGHRLERPQPPDYEVSEGLQEYLRDSQRLRQALTKGFPADEAQLDDEQRAKRLLAGLLEFHRREDNAGAWQYFGWLRMSEQELLDDRGPIAQLVAAGISGKVKKSSSHRYTFPQQEHAIRPGTEVIDPATSKSPGEVLSVNDNEGWLELKRGAKLEQAAHPSALLPNDQTVRTQELRQSLLRVAQTVVDHGLGANCQAKVVRSLLLRASFGRKSAQHGTAQNESAQNESALVNELALGDGRVLAVQGPPGTGKTYSGARLIIEALNRGLRVGITAHSHRAIGNLLREVHKHGVPTAARIAQAAPEQEASGLEGVRAFSKNGDLAKALARERFELIAGTAWLWSRAEVQQDPVDILVLDEAGQMSLANAVAVAPAGRALVLLGDPQQLSQPQKAQHPPGAGVSVLEHLLGDEPTISDDKGIFLAHTYRLHPDVCRFTSDCFYESRLSPATDSERQRLIAPEPFAGTGLRWLPVPHSTNSSESPEEVQVVSRLMNRLLAENPRWVDSHGNEHTLGLNEILVVAPYNAQVQALTKALPPGARVGTVDKFQGQEAPLVIYSMATSSAEDAPRGIEFVLSANRFNVAISRARCVAMLVASPELLRPRCRTPEQMRLANAFARFRELATAVCVG
ncbi:MAG: TM0106 family RecB-like putative nuclease [Myxococcota bacterium]